MGEGVHTVKNAPKTDRSYQRDTDKGLNKQQAYTISKLESKIRDMKYEEAHLVDANGKDVAKSYTKAHSYAKFRNHEYAMAKGKDMILTHNHPNDFGGIAGRIGVPFSANDIHLAALLNLKEVRAVTSTYTYSIRRPENGWGDVRSIVRDLKAYNKVWKKEARNYMDKSRGKLDTDTYTGRANVGIQNTYLKKLAKIYGWDFTRRKVK